MVLVIYNETEGFRRRLVILFKCVIASPGPVNPVSHPHQIMHTPSTRKRRGEIKGNREGEKTNNAYKCKMFWKMFVSL